MDKIKNIKNLPLIILLVVVVIIAIILSIVKASTTSKEAGANTDIKQEQVQENQNEQQDETLVVEIETDENIQEIVDESEEEPKNVEAQYFIRVNYSQNVVTIYTKDTNGEYSIPYKAMVCSTGTATPRSGTYTIPSGNYSRGKWGMMIGNVWAQYFTRIKGSILFHSVPYTEKNKWSLEYWEYDKLGTAASAGCIRLTVEDAKWIYNNCPAGTKVEFYADDNSGPLGKPTAQKISEEEAVRGWDPTDPDENNPWKTYTKEEPEDESSQGNEDKPTTPTTPTTPSTPTNPEPEEPETPTDPEPEEPETPTEPTDPEPEEPETPTEPTDPEPEEPETPADPEPEEPETPTEPTDPEPEDPETPTEPTNPEPEEPETPIEPTDPEPEQPDTSADTQTTEADGTAEKEV